MLQDDGSTVCGCWVYCGSFDEKGENKMMKRDASDPTGLGMYPNWSWSWPVQRRIVYKRASVNAEGQPFSKEKPVLWWSKLKKTWLGDIPDGGGGPDAILPFIMVPHGRGMLFAAGMSDGPFPEHYEPLESVVKNTISSTQVSPVATRWDEKAKEATCNPILAAGCIAGPLYGSEEAKEFGGLLHLSRHQKLCQTGQMTRWLPWLTELVPNQFVEMSEEFARRTASHSATRSVSPRRAQRRGHRGVRHDHQASQTFPRFREKTSTWWASPGTSDTRDGSRAATPTTSPRSSGIPTP